MITKTTHQRIVKEGVYKDMNQLFVPIFSTLASPKHNALYTGLDMFNMTLSVAAMNKFVGQAYGCVRNNDTKVEIDTSFWKFLESNIHKTSANTKVPTPHWFLNRLRQYSKEHLLEQGKQMIIATIQRCKEMGMLKKL